MSTASFVLILAVLLLGGIIATVGDRIGTRVGKARLSLFKLRPRKTATLVTILTGTIISASTFGILFAASEQLRTGVFELEKIERRLRKTRNELDRVNDQKDQVEKELAKARSDQAIAKKLLAETNQLLAGTKQQLAETNESLQAAIAERSQAQTEIQQLQTERSQLQKERDQAVAEREQAVTAKNEAAAQKEEAIRSKNQAIAQIEEEIRAKNQLIQQKEGQIRGLEAQQEYLTLAVQRLQQEAQGLRVGNVAIERGQVLASGVVRIVSPSAAKRAVDELLQAANRQAIQLIRPGSQGQIIQITNAEVDQLIKQIDDGQEYVVRIFSTANYLVGEQSVQIFANAVRNRVVFRTGDIVAATALDPSTMADRDIRQRINLLVAAANFRARNLGILTDSVQIVGPIQTLLTFVEQLKQSKQLIELKAVATEDTYTAGPLKIELIAEQNGQVLYRTQDQPPLPSSDPVP